ncbi:MAG: DinB family protein [Ignavibacteria bacterium]|nr:DinB family protein [Ignavibacteria bacterium]
MSISQFLINELKSESESTQALLERVPLEKSGWKPHEKSMTLGRLASHIAEIPAWIPVTIEMDELDFAKADRKPFIAGSADELISVFKQNISKAIESLGKASDERFSENWTLRTGDVVYYTRPKISVLRSFCFNHLYHHRAQLGVYLRMLDIALPQIYGPTADDDGS